MPIYAIDGLVLPAAAGEITEAGNVTPLSVTAPTVGVFTLDGFFSASPRNHVWYHYQPTENCKLLFDASLSYDTTTQAATGSAKVNVAKLIGGHTYPPASGADVFNWAGGGSSVTVDLVAGEHYWIVVWDTRSAGTTDLILRTSDFGETSDWVQPADQAYILNSAFGDDNSTNYATTVPRRITNWPSVEAGSASPTYAFGGHAEGAAASQGFHGEYTQNHAFNGDYPGDSGGATDCEWTWARKGNWGGQWWSRWPQGLDGDTTPPHEPESWNGTDPYDSGVAGAGYCAVYTGKVDSEGGGGVGFHWHSSTIDLSTGGGGYQSTTFTVEGACERMNLHNVIGQFGPSAGQLDPTAPTGFTGGTIEWEEPTSTLLGMDACPDQSQSSTYTHDGDVGYPVTQLAVRWMLNPVGPNPSEENTPGPFGDTWGPYIRPSDSDPDVYDYHWHGVGTSQDLAEFTDAQAMTLADYDGVVYLDDSLNVHFMPIPSSILNQALSYEDSWSALWAAGVNLGHYSSFAGGLRAVGLAVEQVTGSLPNLDYSTDKPYDAWRYKTGQSVAYRIHLRPARARWRLAPAVPTVEVLVPTGDLDAVRRRFFG